MIASLRGVVAAIAAQHAIIEVQGVGYLVRMSSRDLQQMRHGQEVSVFTTMSVSQDAISLFGFLHQSSQDLFIQLQKVNGVGPRVAMAILSTLTPQQLAQAIHDGDVAALTKAPGLGKKGAQKIVVELSGAVDIESLIADNSSTKQSQQTSLASREFDNDANAYQVVQGLMSLGWQSHDAVEAVKHTIESMGIEGPVSNDHVSLILKNALSYMNRSR